MNTPLQEAVIALNQAIDGYWNDDVRGLGLTGMGEHHMKRITDAQYRCRLALEAEGALAPAAERAAEGEG
jgi:hypothetical protein